MDNLPKDATIGEIEAARTGKDVPKPEDPGLTTLPSEMHPEAQEAPPAGYDDEVDNTFPASDPPSGPVTT